MSAAFTPICPLAHFLPCPTPPACASWLLSVQAAGNIWFSEAVTWGLIVRSPAAVYFLIYTGELCCTRALHLALVRPQLARGPRADGL